MANITESADVKQSMRVFRQVMYIILFVLSILANILLILMLMRKQLRHRRTAKSFICLVQNLAVANILIVVLGIPLDDVWYHDSTPSYPFGAAGCKIIVPLQSAVFQAMIHLFVAVVVQRCYGVMRSLYGQMKFFHAVFLAFFVWIFSLCTGAVPFIVTLKYRNYTCSVDWNTSDQAYMVILFLLQYLLPILAMVVLYIFIRSQLNRYKVLDPERAVRRDRHYRIQRLFVIFVSLFSVLLLPKQIMSFMKAFGDPSGTAYFDDVFKMLDILTFSITILIPVLFIVYNPEFMTDFWVFIKCQCCRPSVMMNTSEISDSFSEESGPIVGSRPVDDMHYSASTPVFQSKYEAGPQPNGGSTSTAPEPTFDMVEASMFKSTISRVATVDRRQEPSPSATPPESEIYEHHPPPPDPDDYDNEML